MFILIMGNFMLVAALSEELFEGWEKLGLFALIMFGLFGFVFFLMKYSKWHEKSAKHKRRTSGLNRKQRREEQARKRKGSRR